MKPFATFLAIALMTVVPIPAVMAQQSAPSSAQSQTQAVLVGSDSLVGSTVRNSEGHDVGKVSRLMIDPNDGRVSSVVIATGGTLGVGSATISVPWNAVKVGQDKGKLIVIASQSLEAAPNAPRQSERQKDAKPAAAPGAEQPPRQQ